MDVIKALEQEQLRSDLPVRSIGDYVKVHLRSRKEAEKGSRYLKNCYRKEGFRSEGNFYSQKTVLRCRSRGSFSCPLTQDQRDRCGEKRKDKKS